jgi:RNA polymerase sigma-70 factor (sigma-E family)
MGVVEAVRPIGGESPGIVGKPGLPEPCPADVSIDLTFEEAFDGLYARAYGVAFQLIGSRPEAEDIAQETLARAYVRWTSVRDYAGPWAVRVAGNLSIASWRRSSRSARFLARADHTPTADAPTADRVDLHRALSRLSKRQREVVVLRYLGDLAEAEVARVLGCSAGSVKQHASRGLAALRTTGLGVS